LRRELRERRREAPVLVPEQPQEVVETRAVHGRILAKVLYGFRSSQHKGRVSCYFDDDAGEATPEDSLVVSYKATDYEAGVTFGWRLR